MSEGRDVNKVSKVVIMADGGKVLILKRAPESVSDASPWEWDLPGGHVQEDESFIEAAVREVEEEVQLSLNKLQQFYMDSSIGKETCFYSCKSWSGKPTLSSEHTDYVWVDPAQIADYNIGSMYGKAVKMAGGVGR